jgi:DNA-binding transcriptional regulator YhcF (GntR family)
MRGDTSVEFEGNIPIYIQIMDMIKRDIITKKIKEGDKLPSVREMADNLKVNPNTIQRVYQELEREGVTFTQRGMGTFITKDKKVILSLKSEMAKEVIISFIDGIESLGFNEEEIIDTIADYMKRREK